MSTSRTLPSPVSEKLRARPAAIVVTPVSLPTPVTATNLGLGALVGVVAALPTLTMGSVAAAVAVAGSAYTGLNTSCDALKDLASALE